MPYIRKKWADSLKLGALVEKIFEIVARENGYSVKRANEYVNRRWRVDFILYRDGEHPKLVDVKARRKKKRYTQVWAWVVEIYNKAGSYVFSKPFTHFAFEISPAEFFIIDKKCVERYIAKVARERGAKLLREPQFYNYYRRDKDVVFIAPEEEMQNLYSCGEVIYLPVTSRLIQPLVEEELRIRREV